MATKKTKKAAEKKATRRFIDGFEVTLDFGGWGKETTRINAGMGFGELIAFLQGAQAFAVNGDQPEITVTTVWKEVEA